nr:NAD-dependent epimerase/dehydratase family protein [Sphingomicrobium lutaoense]
MHPAALGSNPQSIEEPTRYNVVNVTGFVTMLEAARAKDISRIVYASSSAVYCDDPAPEELEEHICRALSRSAVTKRVVELYAIG